MAEVLAGHVLTEPAELYPIIGASAGTFVYALNACTGGLVETALG